jgi:hypothetical protein
MSTRNVRPRKAAGFYAGGDVVDTHYASDDDFECEDDEGEVDDENGKRKRSNDETDDAEVVSGVINVAPDVKRLETYPSSGNVLTDRDKQVIQTLRSLPWEERKKFDARETLSKFMSTMKKKGTTRTTSELVFLYCTRLCESWGLVFLFPDKCDGDVLVLTKANINTVDGKKKSFGLDFDLKMKIRVQNADKSATQDVKVFNIRSGHSVVQTQAEKKASNARNSKATKEILKRDGSMQTVGEERARAVFEPIATGLGRVNGRVREFAVADYQICVDTEPTLLDVWLTPDSVQRQVLGVACKCFTKNKKGGALIDLRALETTLYLGIAWVAQIDNQQGKIRYFLVFPSYRAEDSPLKEYVLMLQNLKEIGITFKPGKQRKSDEQDAFKKFEVTEVEFYEKMKDSIQNPAKYGLQIHGWMTLNCTPEHCRNFNHKKERCYTKIFFEMCMQCGINVRFGKNHGKDDVHVSLDGGETQLMVDLKFRGAAGTIAINGQIKPYKFADNGSGVIFVVQPSSYKDADGLNTNPELYRDMTLFAVRPCDVTQDDLKKGKINTTDLDACRAKCSVTLNFKDIPKTKAGLVRLIQYCQI